MRTIRFALMGFGNVGKAFAKLLISKHEEIRSLYDCDVIITAVTTNSKGNIYKPEGIDLQQILDDLESAGRFSPARCTEKSSMEILETGEYDCVVELSPLNIHTGQPATDYIRTAMERGRHAITANKGPIAWHYRELKELAEARGIGFYHETVVMDGTPVFNLAEHTLKMTRITRVEGILNTTTNYILEEMAKGIAMDEIMARGPYS